MNCAHSVIELVTTSWPNAINDLQPTKGVVDGAIFTHLDDDTHLKQFLVGEK